jgi:hypothetical protein
METIKRFFVNHLSSIIALAVAIPFCTFAGSSFSYAVFQQLLVGNYIVPTVTSNAYATELQQPSVTSTASTTGTLSGGKLYLEVVATTVTGTSSPSAEIATTTSVNENVNIVWSPIPGATGYAVYFGTSTPGSEQSYFAATSTAGVVNTQYSLTSTTSPTYNTPSLNGTGYYASIGSGTSSIAVSGQIQVTSNATTTCSTALNGAIFYSTANSHLWLCTGSGPAWTVIK